MVAYWAELAGRYPIVSLEDGMDEEDWSGWRALTERLGGTLQLVGDDLFVTNTERLARGIREGVANSVLIKINQIGTLSETLAAVTDGPRGRLHGRHEPPLRGDRGCAIADLAVATGCGQIKTGRPRAPTGSPSTTSCCESRSSSGPRPASRARRLAALTAALRRWRAPSGALRR